MSDSNSSSNGIGLGTVLAIVFMVLKLTDNIDWSWWWVFSPIWIPIALVFVIGVPVAIVRSIRKARAKNSFASVVRRAPQDRKQDRLR
jgi:hypothetical protein